MRSVCPSAWAEHPPLEVLNLFGATFSLPLGSPVQHHHVSVTGMAGFATTTVKFLSSLVFFLNLYVYTV